MNLIIKFVFLFAMLVFQISAQNYRLIGPSGGLPNDIEINSSNSKIIYGGANGLFRSKDGGLSTEKIFDAGRVTINQEFPNILYSRKHKSQDGGDNWDEMDISPNPYISGFEYLINPVNTNSIYAYESNYLEMWHTTDGGNNWQFLNQFNNILKALAISRSDTNILYCSADYLLYVSYNAGIDWQAVLDPYPIYVNKIEVNPFNEKSLFLSDYTTLYKSNDEGKTLTPLLSFSDLLAGFVINPNDTLTIYAIGSNLYEYSNFLKTTDGGATWDTLNNGLPGNFAFFTTIAINPVNTDEMYVGINFWGTYKTTDGGLNWQKTNLTTMETSDFYIDPDSAGHIYASIQGLGIKKSTDDGQSWNRLNVPIPPPGSGLFGQMAFHPANKNNFYLCDEGGVHKTTDGGNNWQYTFLNNNLGEELLYSIAIDPFNPLHMLAGEWGYMVATLYLTEDDWSTWSGNSPYLGRTFTQIRFDPNHQDVIYMNGGNAQGILKSTDGGTSWTKKNNGLIKVESDYLPLFLAAIEDTASTLYVAQQKYAFSDTLGGILKSINGGDSWFRIDQSLPYKSALSVAVSPYDNNILYAVIEDSGLYKSSSDGSSWVRVCKVDIGEPFEANIKFDPFDAKKIYVNSEFGIILIEDTVTTNIPKQQLNLPFIINLYQNYPNPFNSTTKIRYEIESHYPVHVRLKVYDILGREIATLININQNSGNYEVTFDGSALSSGVYLYKLVAGKFTYAKKFIIIK